MGASENFKVDLFRELQAVAHLGLTEDLQQMLPRGCSEQEALNLVLNNLTDIVVLVKYLNRNSHKPEVLKKAGLTNLPCLLGKDLEVLCKLEAKGIDVSKEWARNLGKKAPDLKQLARLDNNKLKDLCQGAEATERRDVYDIIVEYHIQRLALRSQCKITVEENKSKKHDDISKLKKAKRLCNEAKTLASTSQSEVSGKIAIIAEILELPQDWLKGEGITSQPLLLENLDKITDKCTNAMKSESAETYGSNIDVITKASAGRALYAVYDSRYEAPKTASSKLLQVPTAVTFANPKNASQRVIYEAYSEKGVASNFAEQMSKLGFGTGASGAALNGMLTARGRVAFNEETQRVKSDEKSFNTASALYYIRTDKKTFQFTGDDMRLSSDCVKNASDLVVAHDRTDSARKFLESYGSHFPTGVQTLGGVFFTTADVESECNQEIATLKNKAQRHLESQISIRSGKVGMFEGHIFGGTENSKSHTEHINDVKTTFSFRAYSIGPAANYATFHKLLSNNSNWALIDRGDFKTANIPVWKLVKDLGGVFEDAAKLLEDTWNSDELKRQEKCEKIEEETKAKEELQEVKAKHLTKEVLL